MLMCIIRVLSRGGKIDGGLQDFIKGVLLYYARKFYVPRPLLLKPHPFSACFGEQELALPINQSVLIECVLKHAKMS